MVDPVTSCFAFYLLYWGRCSIQVAPPLPLSLLLAGDATMVHAGVRRRADAEASNARGDKFSEQGPPPRASAVVLTYGCWERSASEKCFLARRSQPNANIRVKLERLSSGRTGSSIELRPETGRDGGYRAPPYIFIFVPRLRVNELCAYKWSARDACSRYHYGMLLPAWCPSMNKLHSSPPRPLPPALLARPPASNRNRPPLPPQGHALGGGRFDGGHSR